MCGPAVDPRGGVGYGRVMGGARVPTALYGQPGRLAVDQQVGGLAVGLGRRVGYGGVLGGTGALSSPYRQSGGLSVGPGRRLGHGGALGSVEAIGAPLVALGRTAHDVLDAPGVGRALLGDSGAGDPSATLGKQPNGIVTARAVTSWSNPTIRLSQVVCGGRPVSMQRAAV